MIQALLFRDHFTGGIPVCLMKSTQGATGHIELIEMTLLLALCTLLGTEHLAYACFRAVGQLVMDQASMNPPKMSSLLLEESSPRWSH